MFWMVVPWSSLISPMKSISVCSAPRLRASASSLPGIFTMIGVKYSALILPEVIHFERDGQFGYRIAHHQRVLELPSLYPRR